MYILFFFLNQLMIIVLCFKDYHSTGRCITYNTLNSYKSYKITPFTQDCKADKCKLQFVLQQNK